MLVPPLAAIPPVVEGGMQLVIGIYREVAPTHIIKRADGKFDQGIDILDNYRALMTPEQIEQITAMAQRVEAARPSQPSGPTMLRDLLRNPFNKVTVARKYKRICKEYLHFVQRTSQLARVQAAERDVLLAWSEKNGTLSPAASPMTEVHHKNGTPTAKIIDVPRAVGLEIERAAGPGAEMSVKFRDVKLSVGATTSVKLEFTPSGVITVSLGLIQVPSLTQREDGGVAPVPTASGKSAHAAVEEDNTPHIMTPQPSGLARNPSIISLSGTATIFPRQTAGGDLHRGGSDTSAGKNMDAVNKANVHSQDSDDRVTYALRFDGLEYHAEVEATPTQV